MIPDEMRNTIEYALQHHLEAIDYKFGSTSWELHNEEKRVATIKEWLNALPQAPQPDWSQAPEWAQWGWGMLYEVRSDIREFAKVMEAKLAENDHKGGWDECHLLWLQAKLTEEVGELGELLVDTHHPHGDAAPISLEVRSKRIIEECADVANVAMMIADLVGKRTRSGGGE